MNSVLLCTRAVFVTLLLASLSAHAQLSWVQQPTALQSNPTTHVQVGGLWGIAMSDTGTGFAVGYASVANGFSGVLRKLPGNPTWFVLPATSFTGLPIGHNLWSAVSVVGQNIWVCGSNSRVYKSTDNGNSWNPSDNGITGNFTLFDIYFKNANEGMLVGSTARLYYTSDGGANWIPQSVPYPLPVNTELYAVHSAGAYWYISGGPRVMLKGMPQIAPTNWSDMSLNLPGNIVDIEGLQFLDDNVGTTAGVTMSGSPLHRTTNGGNSYTTIGGSLPVGAYNTVHFFNDSTGWTGNAIPALYHTSNGGASWSNASIVPLPSQSISNLLTKMSFVNPQLGYAAGGAPGGSSTGWILRYAAALLPDISSTPTVLDFGRFSCGSSTSRQFTIFNSGTAPLNIQSIVFSSPEFSLLGPIPGPVPVSGGATINIRWTPAQPGPIPPNTSMTIHSDDATHPTWVVDLTGIFNTAILNLASSYTFPTVCVGDTAEIATNVTVQGSAQPRLIAFEHVSGVQGITLSEPPLGSDIDAFALFRFRYAPSIQGPYSGVYRLMYGDPLCPKEAIIHFDGIANSSSVTASPVVVDFGEVCIGKFKDMIIMMSNTGTVPALLTSRALVSGRDAFPNQHFAPFGPIPQGDGLAYTVRFSPSQADTGIIEAVYSFRVDPCGEPLLITLRGFGVKASIVFHPTSILVLGPVAVGQNTQEQVTIRNNGTVSIDIESLALIPPSPRLSLTNLPSLPQTLAPGQATTVTVRFTPDRIETIFTELLVVYGGLCSDSARLSITATSASTPTIAVPSRLDFGRVQCPGEHTDTVWVRNIGGGPLTITSLNIEGRDRTHFLLRSPTPPRTVAVNDSLAIIIGYTAPGPHRSEAELVIWHDDVKTWNTSIVQLHAERIHHEWSIEGDSTAMLYACLGDASQRSFQVRNSGAMAIELQEVRVLSGGDEFRVVNTALPAEIPSASTYSFDIMFTPTSTGERMCVVELAVGPCGETALLTLRGRGDASELSFDPPSIDFNAVPIGADAARTVRVGNPGTESMTVTELLLRPSDGPGSGVFVITPAQTLPFRIDPGREHDLTVRFTPEVMQEYNAELCFVISTPCPDTLCVELRGEGMSSGTGLTRNRLMYILDPCGVDELCDSVEVVNGGPEVVSITAASIDQDSWFRMASPPSLPADVPPGGRLSIVLCASANFTGERHALLRLSTSDASVPELHVSLQASRDSSSYTVRETLLDFGVIAWCQTADTLSVTLTNTGDLIERINTSQSYAPFIFDDGAIALPPGESREILIRFDPDEFGMFVDTLLLWDDRCTRVEQVILRGAMPARPAVIEPAELLFSGVVIGSTEIKNITFENRYFSMMRISDVRITPAGNFESWGAYPKNVVRGSTVELPILYNPRDAGPHEAIACIIIDTPCPDTICVTLSGVTSEVALHAEPSSLEYGILSQCGDVTRTLTLRNEGNDRVQLLESRIEGRDAALFAVDAHVFPGEELPGHSERVFVITALASATQNDGIMEARFIIDTDKAGQPSLEIPLRFDRRTQVPPEDVLVDFGIVNTGIRYEATARFMNTGSMDIQIDAADLPGDYAIIPEPRFSIEAGETIDIDVRFTPSYTGVRYDTLLFQSHETCGISTRIFVRSEVIDGVSVHDLDMGTLPRCLSSMGYVVVRNLYQEEVTLVTLRIVDGPDASHFAIISPVSVPLVIAPYDSIIVELLFTPEATLSRTYLAALTFDFDIPGERMIITSVVEATAVDALLAGPATLDFGSVEVAALPESRTLMLTNANSFPIRVESLSLTGDGFALVDAEPTLPAEIRPGGRLELTVSFQPPSVGIHSASLSLEYSAPCTDEGEIALTGEGVDSRFAVSLRMPTISGEPDDIVEFPILIDHDIGLSIAEWSGAIRFNASMLYPIALRSQGTLSEHMRIDTEYEHGSGKLGLTAYGGTMLSGSGILAVLRFIVLVGNDTVSTMRFDDDFSFGPGARIDSVVDGKFVLEGYCLAGGRRLIGERPGLRLHAGRPNPFAEQTVLTFELDDDGHTELRLFDAAGREVLVLVNAPMFAGVHSIVLNGMVLPTGSYTAVLMQRGGFAIQRLLKSR